MDTLYYNLKARRVKVSGGEELVTFIPAPAPTPVRAKAVPPGLPRLSHPLAAETAGDG